MKPSVSIILCTRNRASDLKQTLAALSHLCLTDDLPAELIVVDNGSSDNTADIAQQAVLPDLPPRCLFVSEPGLSRARNAGHKAAGGDIFLFTDDDVRPPADWVTRMCAPILANEADAVTGGFITPDYLLRDWMERNNAHGPNSSDEIDPRYPIGLNMAYHRRVLDRIPSYDEELGAGALGFGEDSLFAQQIEAAGLRVADGRGIQVEHHFDARRLQRAALRGMERRRGRSMAYIDYHWAHREAASSRRTLLREKLRLAYHSAYKGEKWPYAEGMPGWESSLNYWIAYHEHYLNLRGSSRHYDLRGLRKLR